MVGIFGQFFLVSVSYETKHENSSKNSERNSGQNPGQKFEKFGELSFCDFSDLSLSTTFHEFLTPHFRSPHGLRICQLCGKGFGLVAQPLDALWASRCPIVCLACQDAVAYKELVGIADGIVLCFGPWSQGRATDRERRLP